MAHNLAYPSFKAILLSPFLFNFIILFYFILFSVISLSFVFISSCCEVNIDKKPRYSGGAVASVISGYAILTDVHVTDNWAELGGAFYIRVYNLYLLYLHSAPLYPSPPFNILSSLRIEW